MIDSLHIENLHLVFIDGRLNNQQHIYSVCNVFAHWAKIGYHE